MGFLSNPYHPPIGLGAMIAFLIDISRLSIYGAKFGGPELLANSTLLLCATSSAFLGAYLGNRFLKKVTMTGVQRTVAIMLFFIAGLMCLGLI